MGGLISHVLKCQNVITLPLTKAEDITAAHVLQEGLWIWSLLCELGITFLEPIPVHLNNTGTISLSTTTHCLTCHSPRACLRLSSCVFMMSNKSLFVTFLFILASLIIWDHIPTSSPSPTLYPPLLHFNPVIAHPDYFYCHPINPFWHLDSLRLPISCLDKSSPYPSHISNHYWTLGQVYTHTHFY